MAGNVTVQIKGLDELRAAFKRAPDVVEPILQRTVEAAQFVLQKHTLKDDPIPWRTGNLLQSFRFFKGRLRGSWIPTATYAFAVHEPRPSSKEGGKDYPGNPYMDRLVDKAQPDLDNLFDSALDKIIAQFGK